MNCLSSEFRLKTTKEFDKVYKANKKWHTTSFVIFYQDDTSSIKNGFVASKKVGNAVQRNSAKRRMKAIFMQYCNKIKNGKYIMVAKDTIGQRGYEDLKKDFLFALKRMNLTTSQ
ncbi:ribonuclease P protein component [Arcobacter sp. FWKO B]|uniref:ribonuclease P protein component n=1 Tax=Arcobacter sp. FWKO B TaxID=2593672 RepID=UPI0018A35423|nr:ribonuclease P protein component [Arcobacter sp. FWKO B]QOG12809.1 ribonuclease P protein component [Arcobacter sp. FWKO B]